MSSTRNNLIKVGHAEGISYLLLLFIAMPLKYMADMPLPVRVVGSIHGVLFVLFIALILIAFKKLNLSVLTTVKLFLLSLIPFGTFYLHKFIPSK